METRASIIQDFEKLSVKELIEWLEMYDTFEFFKSEPPTSMNLAYKKIIKEVLNKKLNKSAKINSKRKWR